MSIFDELLSKSGLEKAELEEKLEEFKRKNPDLNSEIASFFIAKELGIDIDDSKLVITPLNLLDTNTKNANILVIIDKIFPKKEYNNNNKQGTIQNCYVTDNTARLQLTLWNNNDQLNQGDVILVTNIYTNTFKDELKINTSKFSSIKVKDSKKIERVYNEKKLYELQDKDTNLSVTGILKTRGELKEFESQGQMKNVLRFVLSSDGFQNNCVAWGKSAQEVLKLNENSKIKIDDCYAKLNKGQMELHLNDYTKFNVVEENAQEYVAPKKNLQELAYNEVAEIHAKAKDVINSRYVRVCKVCNNAMMKIDDKYFCSFCNSEQESYAKANIILNIEDDSGNTNAILTKKILMQLLNCNEDDLENKIHTIDFNGMPINCIGYLRKTKMNENEFFVNNLI